MGGILNEQNPPTIMNEAYSCLYNNQINARALIGQSAVCYCYYKPTEKYGVFWIII